MSRNPSYLILLLAAALITVTTANAADPNDPNSVHLVPDDYATIQSAIDAAAAGDTVLVKDGIYTPTVSTGIDFGGKAITVRSENGPTGCIIDCGGAGRGFWFRNHETLGSIVDGFTITGGDVFIGAGIDCVGDSGPTIKNCIITHCHADFSGGGFMLDGAGHAVLRNCLFVGNSTASVLGGGALHCDGGSLTLVNCTLTENDASAGLYSSGGALLARNGAVVNITNCILWGDTPDEIRDLSGNITITYSDVAGGWTGDGNIDTDPLFVDPTGGDYHLIQDGITASPCIDAGDNTAVAIDATDLDGTPRVVGTVDMGAFEGNAPDVMIQQLAVQVMVLNLHNGIENSLDSKLDAALQALDDANQNNDVAAVNSLQAFINSVQAQSGNKIPVDDANDLIDAAQSIIDLLIG